MRDPTPPPPALHRRSTVWFALLGALSLDYLVLGLASTGATRALGIAGAMLVGAGLALAFAGHRLIALGVIIVGAIPLPLHTWSSIVTPAVGLVTIATALALTWHLQHRSSAHEETLPSLDRAEGHPATVRAPLGRRAQAASRSST